MKTFPQLKMNKVHCFLALFFDEVSPPKIVGTLNGITEEVKNSCLNIKEEEWTNMCPLTV
jgi:hypothetical protein